MNDQVMLPANRRLGWLAAGAAVGVLAAVMAAPALTPVRAAADSTTTDHTLTVSGVGTVFVKPDVADVSLGVSVTKPKARDAEAAAAAQMQAVIAALKAQGVAEDDIQTVTLSLDPVYDYNSNTPKLVGYQSTNIVNVTVRDLTKAGAIVDAATEAGANNISGITFRREDQALVESQARTKAMADAKAKADELATAGGVAITGTISIAEMSSPTPSPVPFAAGVAADRAETPVLGGNVELSVTVTVVYSIQ